MTAEYVIIIKYNIHHSHSRRLAGKLLSKTLPQTVWVTELATKHVRANIYMWGLILNYTDLITIVT